jgi:hypothetical protein
MKATRSEWGAKLGGAVEPSSPSKSANHLPGFGLAHALARLGDEQRPGCPAAQVVIEYPAYRGREHRAIASAALAL